jgi:hypothetical protein
MPGITLQSGLISYYGNPAGYTEKDKAVVDRIFQNDELAGWLRGRGLSAEWTDGVMERLIAGERPDAENAAPLKNVRIWQLRSDVDVRMKFISYPDMARQFGEPCPEDYLVAYDGQLDTNDLEAIYDRFDTHPPVGFSGQALAMSDVVELYDGSGGEFYYTDRRGFQKISFAPREQTQDMKMKL